MICPRCAKEIPDNETICPFCMQEINRDMEFNDFREDGFVQIQAKGDSDFADSENYKPKYFDISEYNIFVIAVIFVLAVSVFTVFSLRFVQKRGSVYVPKYVSTEPATEAETEPVTETIKNTVKKQEINNLYGSWKVEGTEETDYSAIPYFTFAKNGYMQENYGTMIVKGSYKDISEDDQPRIYISTETNLRGAYDYEVTGNDDDGYKLTLTDVDTGEITTLEKTEAKMKQLGTINGYHIDKDLLGAWLTKDKKKAYKFVKSGKLKRVSNKTVTYGVYTVDRKNQLIIKYMKDTIKTVELTYKVYGKGNKLIINDTVYYKRK